MKTILTLLITCSLQCHLASHSIAQAQTYPPYPSYGDVATYAPGWQMVGGPLGAVFPVSTLYEYSDSTYVAAEHIVTSWCTGSFAYFDAVFAVPIPLDSSAGIREGEPIECPLHPDWNLVGNPVGWDARIVTPVTAYFWNGTLYEIVSNIRMGRAVWIYSPGIASLALLVL